MNKQELKELIRENIYLLLEEDTRFNEGEPVSTNSGEQGVITLAKHPFYAVKLNDTGTTQSFHFGELVKDETALDDSETDYGKYDISDDPNIVDDLSESAPTDVLHLNGTLSIREELNMGDVLSDIRSITGITVVRPIDIPGETNKSKLHIKIDPYPFNHSGEPQIKTHIRNMIRKVPGVKEFFITPDTIQELKFKIKN